MLIIIHLTAINLITFVLYGTDKLLAKTDKRRIPERVLLFFAILGGSIGALTAMLLFRHKTRKKKFSVTVPIIAFIECAFCVFCLYQNLHITVTEYAIDTGKLPEGSSVRIVQISDLHNQIYGLHEELLTNRIRGLSPDIIAVTGDAVDSRRKGFSITEDFFAGCADIAPVYYVRGNHEERLVRNQKTAPQYDEYIRRIKDMGVIIADGEVFVSENCVIAGAGNGNTSYTPDLSGFDTLPTVLLAHYPSGHAEYEKSGTDIVLTGHIHGGQINIPGKGGLLSPEAKFFPELYEGVHEFGNTRMVISRGMGNSALPLRINNYPEIVVINIT